MWMSLWLGWKMDRMLCVESAVSRCREVKSRESPEPSFAILGFSSLTKQPRHWMWNRRRWFISWLTFTRMVPSSIHQGTLVEVLKRRISNLYNLGENQDRQRTSLSKFAPNHEKMSLVLQVSSKSVSTIVESELGLTPYRVQKAEVLSGNNNLVRIQKCKSTFAGTRQNERMRMMFGDEKLLTHYIFERNVLLWTEFYFTNHVYTVQWDSVNAHMAKSVQPGCTPNFSKFGGPSTSKSQFGVIGKKWKPMTGPVTVKIPPCRNRGVPEETHGCYVHTKIPKGRDNGHLFRPSCSFASVEDKFRSSGWSSHWPRSRRTLNSTTHEVNGHHEEFSMTSTWEYLLLLCSDRSA
ncbi:Protein CBG17155 [Caenorhabditis briggsae]|uniref:Protein CBG17155 n=1 Tax=Caenorhabditis briggsae TaxID=6238 RepID=A8XQN4_CAEBR|nr:Protein CBG17155 [Caenorhabditis briggsae]CAP34959.1 Protein CBG17155 [Caenorhabditis briggsae]